MKIRLAIFGAGGHAKMAIEASRSQGKYDPVLCVARGVSQPSILGVPVILESDSALNSMSPSDTLAFVAIGENAVRAAVTATLKGLGFRLATIVAQGAWLSPSARVGSGTVIMPGSVVGADVSLGEGVIVNTCASVDHDCTIDSFAHIGPGVRLAGFVQVGEMSLLGVGSQSIPQRRIGSHCVLGAGAVLVRDMPSGQTWVGCPARPHTNSRVKAA